MNFPQMVKVSQNFSDKKIENPAAFIDKAIDDSGFINKIKPGWKIAITAGSRGISNIPAILGIITAKVKSAGGIPFIVPSMGSHGGGTAAGQTEMLESLGISEETTGAKIISSMETIKIGTTSGGAEVFADKNAFEADGIIVINRIKLHTAYHGDVESGLCKMTVVGLGKKNGAETVHKMGLGYVITDCFKISRERLNIIFGVGILENALDETADIVISSPLDFEKTDSELLKRCWQIIPRIPFDKFDILIVDEMGKNISGTGMDTNIIGFWRRFGGEKKPDYTTLIVRNLTPESHGNAMGIGLADLITKRLADTIDIKATYTNAMTSQWSMGRIPITLENDFECLKAAISKHDPENVRIVRIKNTLELKDLYISENMLSGINHERISVSGNPVPIMFDEKGYII